MWISAAAAELQSTDYRKRLIQNGNVHICRAQRFHCLHLGLVLVLRPGVLIEWSNSLTDMQGVHAATETKSSL